RVLPIDVLLQTLPYIVWHLEENLNDLGIELPAGPDFDFLAGRGKCLRGAVWAVRGHGVEGVGDGENARAERDLITLQATGIPGPVVVLLVGVNDLGSLQQKRDSGENLVSPVAVLVHDGHFFV